MADDAITHKDILPPADAAFYYIGQYDPAEGPLLNPLKSTLANGWTIRDNTYHDFGATHYVDPGYVGHVAYYGSGS